MNENKRIVWVDYLKAFTCLLVVIGHLLQSLQKAGIPQNLQLTNFIIYLFVSYASFYVYKWIFI